MVRFPFSAAIAVVTIAALGATGASLSGCIVAAAGGASATGYAVLAEDLSPDQQLRDFQIQADVRAAWGGFNQEMAHRLDATVFDGQVLITGYVPDEHWRREAVKRAEQVRGVRRVLNQVSVGPDTHFIDAARDSLITTQLRGELIADIDIKSINYTIKTDDRIVYLLGLARSKLEMDRVISHARRVAGVRRVNSFITVLAAPEPQLNAPPPPEAGDDEDDMGPGPDDDRTVPPPPRRISPPPSTSVAPPPPSGSSDGGSIKAEPLGPQ